MHQEKLWDARGQCLGISGQLLVGCGGAHPLPMRQIHS